MSKASLEGRINAQAYATRLSSVVPRLSWMWEAGREKAEVWRM